jgi:hypothetical protein
MLPQPRCQKRNAAIRGMTTTRRYLLVVGLLGIVWIARLDAAIVGTSDTVLVPTDLPYQVMELQNPAMLFAFEENSSVILPDSIITDAIGYTPATTISYGTEVDSHFIHGQWNELPVTISGSITFDNDILGVIVSDNGLQNTDFFLGLPDVQYPEVSTKRGLEFYTYDPTQSDRLWISPNLRTIEMQLSFGHDAPWNPDQFRVITLSGEPVSGMTFSISAQGPTAGSFGTGPAVFDSFLGQEIDGHDLLTVGLPAPTMIPEPNPPVSGASNPPGILFLGSPSGLAPSLGLAGVAVGGELDEGEIDALSYGRDEGNGIFFSVDEFTKGVSDRPGGVAPNANSEGAVGALEASADVFVYRGPKVPTQQPTVWAFGNSVFLDGDGSSAEGLGLIEPNTPDSLVLQDVGDHLDAMDIDTLPADMFGPFYFSLDSSFNDPLEPAGSNIGTAAASGFVGGDVLLQSTPGAITAIYASAQHLGLDIAGADTDDLDALALSDNGDMMFDPSTDEILFSVRRGSAIIGQQDSLLGLPIEPGDVLTAPALGSPLGTTPGIVIPAEALGLETSRPSGSGPAVATSSLVGSTSGELSGLDSGQASIDGDMDCDGTLDLPDDQDLFVVGLIDDWEYSQICHDRQQAVPQLFDLPLKRGNFDDDFTSFDFRDIEGFKQAFILTSPGPLSDGFSSSLPEPSALLLITIAACCLAGLRGWSNT